MTTCVRCRLEVDPYDDGVEFTFTESTGMVHTSCEFNFLRDELSRRTAEHETEMGRMRGLLVGRTHQDSECMKALCHEVTRLRALLVRARATLTGFATAIELPERWMRNADRALAESDPEAKT